MDAEKIVLTLVHFKRVEYDDLPKNNAALLSKEKKGEEITRRIVTTMQLAQAIKIVTYLANNSEDLDNNSSATSESVIGIAVKNGSTTWTVIEQQISVTSDDLMDPLWFYVKWQCLNNDQNLQERKKQSAKMKRV